MRFVAFPRWLYSGYDWPVHRDWLAWLGLVVTAAVVGREVNNGDPWALLAVPFALAFYGWLLGAVRNVVRGYREPAPRREGRQRH